MAVAEQNAVNQIATTVSDLRAQVVSAQSATTNMASRLSNILSSIDTLVGEGSQYLVDFRPGIDWDAANTAYGGSCTKPSHS